MVTTLEKYLEACRIIGKDRDIYVDGIDSIAYCGTLLTDEGREHFKDCLSLPVENGTVYSDDEKDYRRNGKLQLAWELLYGMAGYCRASDWDKWFLCGE